MKAEAQGLKFLVNEGKLIIPFFQRTYVWTEENWEDLLEELLNKSKRTNFLGAIILKQLPSASGQPKQAEVIDGQQRLTTLSILLKALYDILPDDKKKNCEWDVMSILRYKKDYVSGKDEPKIEHSRVDSEHYKQVMEHGLKGNILDLYRIGKKDHLILQCYKYFVEKLRKMNEEDVYFLLNRLLDPGNKMLVVIDLDEKDDEQAIFETLNTAGVRLTSADIIKNAIFSELRRSLNNDDEVYKFYEKTWERTFLGDEDDLKYWTQERTTGRLMRQNIEILLHSIAVVEGFFDPDKDTLADLSKCYKEKISELGSPDDIKHFVEKIIEYAQIYKEKLDVLDDDRYSFEDHTKRLLHILDELEITTFHPFLLYVFKEHKDEEERLEILKKLERFVVLNQLAKVEDTKSYNKLAKQFISNPSNLDKKLEEVIRSHRVHLGLEGISNRDAKLILFWVELYRRYKDKKYDENSLRYSDYELEHIMPRKWEQYWSFDKVPHPDNSLLEEEKREDRNKKINWIGNLTLLRGGLNRALKNRGFHVKMEGEGRKKGIRHYASLSITKEIVDAYDNDRGDKVWNERKIEERTERLWQEIKEIWMS